MFYAPLIIGQFKFEKPVVIGKEQGYHFNDITGAKKGKDGFIWMGSSEGICRFDGQQLKVFKLTDNLNNPPFDNKVATILPVENEIWAGTSQGLSVMNSRDYTFRHYQLTENGKSASVEKKVDQHVSVLFRDRSGNIWIGTRKGIYMYDDKKDDFRFYPHSRKDSPVLFPSLGSDIPILSIEASQTNDSTIWAGTPAGLQEINKYTGRVKIYNYPQENKDYQIAVNAFRRLYHHDDGLLYVGSWAAGANVFDPVKKTFTPLQIKNEQGKKLLSKAIGSICRKNDHEIWITSLAGLAIYDSKLKDVTWYKLNNNVENEFYAVDYIDEANRVWHTDVNGLQYFDPVMQQFTKHSFKDLSGPDWAFAFYILSDKTGNNITVCPRWTDGLYRFDRIKQKWSKFLFPRNATFKSEKDAIRGFVQLPSGDFIISADRGMFVYSEKTKKVTLLKDQLPFSVIRRGEILLDHAQNLWIAEEEVGLIKWKPGTRQYKIYKVREPSTDTTPVITRMTNLFEDSKGNIWFQKTGGFGIYVAAKDSIKTFLYTNNEQQLFSCGLFFC